MSTINEAKMVIREMYIPNLATYGIAYAEQVGYDSPEELLSLAISRILYSNGQLLLGDRFPIERGFIEDYLAGNKS